MSNLNGFSPVLPESIIERALIADYLLGQGYLLCDLPFLAMQDADRLYEEACRYARIKAQEVAPQVSLESYFAVGFSFN